MSVWLRGTIAKTKAAQSCQEEGSSFFVEVLISILSSQDALQSNYEEVSDTKLGFVFFKVFIIFELHSFGSINLTL